MKLDAFNHLFPKPFFQKFIDVPGAKDMGKRVKNMATIMDLDARFKVMDEFDEYSQVISLPQPPIESLGGPNDSPAIARMANDGLVELVEKYPARFPGFVASLAMNNPDEAIKETLRAVNDLGASGVQIYTNANGVALDHPQFQGFWDEIAKRDITVWMHPARTAQFTDYLTEPKSQYEIWWTFGWPYETSVAMARMVFAGFFDRYPKLKVITHHMGGMIPYFEGRVGYGWDVLGTRTSDVDYEPLLKSMKKRPVDYFKNFYADTALFGGGPATRCGLEFFGVDNCLFASDVPFEPAPGLYIRETIKVIEGLGLSAEDKDKIYHKNALKLFPVKRLSAVSK
jgi:uncharacterized protein